MAVSGMSLILDPHLHRPGIPGPYPALSGLCRWDCAWYERVGLEGYRQPEWTILFPLFPLLGRALSNVTPLSVLQSLYVINYAASLMGVIVVYKIFLELEGEAVARTSLTFFVFWPFSFIQAAPYPESIMLLTTALAIFWSMRGRHIWAGTAVGLGTLARHLSLLAVLSLLVAQIRERGIHPRRFLLHPGVLGLAIPFAFLSLYCVYCLNRFHDPFAWWTMRTYWGGSIAWQGAWQWLTTAGWEPQIGFYVVFSLLVALGAVLLLTRKNWWILAGFGLGLILVVETVGLAALGRYSAAAWPAFLPLGRWLSRHPSLELPVLCGFAVIQGMFVYLFTHSYPIN